MDGGPDRDLERALAAEARAIFSRIEDRVAQRARAEIDAILMGP